MFERLNTPEEIYNYKLGAALNMERTVIKILQSNIDESQDDRVTSAFRHHLDETEGHLHNLEEIFRIFGWEIDDSPCPAIDGIMAEGKANAKKADDALVDNVLLQGAVEVEHHEIATYENLIINARTLGRNDVVNLLQRNLESEQQTLQKAKALEEQIAATAPRVAGGDERGLMDKMKNAVSG